MTTKDIEEKATIAIRDIILKTGNLESYIKDNDKTPSWDGHVFIYNNSGKNKRDIIGTVDVQVKGTINDDFSQSEIKFDVDVVDLQNYAKTGGTIYFIVYISPDFKTKIYYLTLPPVKLFCILSTCENQKTKRLSFEELPDNLSKVSNIFLNFFYSSKKQSSFPKEIMIPYKDVLHDRHKVEVTGFVSSFGGNFEDALLNNEVFFYAKKDGVNIPILGIPGLSSVEEIIDANITVKGKLFYNKINRIKTKTGITVRIGKSFSFPLQKEAPSKITYKLCENLNDRIVDLDFLISVIQNGGYELNGQEMSISLSEEENKNFNIEKSQSALNFIKKVKYVFDILHIRKDLNLTKVTHDEWNRIQMLITAFYYNELIHDWESEVPFIGCVNVQNICIALIFYKPDLNKNNYQLYDAFNYPQDFVCSEDDKEEDFVLPIFSLLTVDDYCKIDNIEYDKIIQAYKKLLYITSDITRYANLNMLRLIEAYDRTSIKQQLDAANDINNWIQETEESENIITRLNALQIAKRQRALTEAENLELINIVESREVSEDILVGAYLLMDNHIAAKIHFNKMSEEEQEFFKSYPLYKRFWI